MPLGGLKTDNSWPLAHMNSVVKPTAQMMMRQCGAPYQLLLYLDRFVHLFNLDLCFGVDLGGYAFPSAHVLETIHIVICKVVQQLMKQTLEICCK